MKKQVANPGRRLSAADMKKLLGGGGVGSGSTGGFRCAAPLPQERCLTVYIPGGDFCCKCCENVRSCNIDRGNDPACRYV